MVEGILLGAHWVAVAVDLVEQVSRLVQAVITDVHILLFHILRPTCKNDKLVSGKGVFAQIQHQRARTCFILLQGQPLMLRVTLRRLHVTALHFHLDPKSYYIK